MRISKPITFDTFPGMDNVAPKGGKADVRIHGSNAIIPQIILNMYATPDGKLIKRQGSALFVAIEDVHSLVSDGMDLFCAGKGTSSPESIWKVSPLGAKTELGAIRGKFHPMSYIFVNNKGYISSKVWNGVYVYQTQTIRQWGTLYNDDPSSIDSMYSSEQMITLGVIPAPFMENLCLWGSRIWGSVDNRIYYSDPPLAFEMYLKDSFLEFNGDIIMIARTIGGMYFATIDSTWFASGLQPESMIINHVGEGVLPGSLQYGLLQKISKEVIPIWTSPSGIVAGSDNGSIIPLTLQRVKFDVTGRAAAFFKTKPVPQYLTNFPLPSDAVFGDSITCEVFRNGKLI